MHVHHGFFFFFSLSRRRFSPSCMSRKQRRPDMALSWSLTPTQLLPAFRFFFFVVLFLRFALVSSSHFFFVVSASLLLSPPLPFPSSPEIRQLAALHAHDHMAWQDAKRMSHHHSASPRARPRGRPTSPMAFREATWAGKERIWMERPVLLSLSLSRSPSFLFSLVLAVQRRC